MSFNAKNLAYEANEPSFLRKLKSQYGNTSGRLERPAPRPRKPKDDDDDDGPTYVYEETNEVLTKEQYEALMGGKTDKEDKKPAGDQADQGRSTSKAGEEDKASAETETETSAPKQNLAEIGGPRKRKQAKIVGDEKTPEKEEAQPQGAISRKPKQKKKKIKLSFDEEA